MGFISHSKPFISDEDRQAISKCLDSGALAAGAASGAFERQVGEYLGYKFSFATSNGSSALKLILHAIGIKKGDEVILPTYVCHSVYDVVVECGATPVLCDVSENWIMTPETVKSCINPSTKAIILVHVFGIDASHPDFIFKNITIIHDYCQSFGLRSEIDGPAFCSFNATKCLTTGEGGMALFKEQAQYEIAVEYVGKYNYLFRLSDLQANLGLSQLSQYDNFLSKRKRIANNYLELIDPKYLKNTLKIMQRSMFFRFPMKVTGDVDELIKQVEGDHDIAIRKGVDELLHRRYRIRNDRVFPMAVSLFNETVSLPIYPSLSINDQERVINVINSLRYE